jgi:hypothetical protein
MVDTKAKISKDTTTIVQVNNNVNFSEIPPVIEQKGDLRKAFDIVVRPIFSRKWLNASK